MTRINKTALVHFSIHDMYALVTDIKSYPKFLPWCQDVKVLSYAETGVVDETKVVAEMTMGSVGLNKTFTTTNVLKRDESIDIYLLEGPFSRLQGHWKFLNLGGVGCKIALEMEFAISNRLLRASLGPVFTKIVDGQIDAFIKRANLLYAK